MPSPPITLVLRGAGDDDCQLWWDFWEDYCRAEVHDGSIADLFTDIHPWRALPTTGGQTTGADGCLATGSLTAEEDSLDEFNARFHAAQQRFWFAKLNLVYHVAHVRHDAGDEDIDVRLRLGGNLDEFCAALDDVVSYPGGFERATDEIPESVMQQWLEDTCGATSTGFEGWRADDEQQTWMWLRSLPFRSKQDREGPRESDETTTTRAEEEQQDKYGVQ
ncbi:hypothetical protein DCS_04047 [Drechmeria coniospora]|uniref:Uncharacterized protein n=1 Tax=Drechmeria coniospora TaxID=98403 RepID=A0A151GIV9_DRECN|nr:hypothetical protein DCS_04047 [Drechmeria coniospora]KYK57040.1 hypothetical protein DCS_04047 [Drechmeria coniospora]ODA78944.1 hypothetical protein RJ55_04534 [Drechmeria coniospora]